MLCMNNIITTGLSSFKYKIGQLYMIARHSLEQSDDGEGVEVIENKECFDPEHGKGQYTEKRIHLSRYGTAGSDCMQHVYSFMYVLN